MSVDRLPPHDLDAERAVLGSCLIDADAMTVIADVVRPADFYRQDHQRTFDAMVDLYGRREPIDLVTLSAELQRRGDLDEVGGSAWLTGLANATPTAVNVEHYAHIVADKAVSRGLISVAGKIAALGYEDVKEVGAQVDKAEMALFQMRREGAKGFVSIGKVMSDVYDRVDAIAEQTGELIGIPSGLQDLDRLTGGFQKSNLIVIAARTSVGKTALALNIAEHAAVDKGFTVGFLSLEMSEMELGMRLGASRSGVSLHNIRLGRLSEAEWATFARAYNNVVKAPLHIDATPSVSIMDARSKARRFQMQHGLDLLVVDYLQLMSATKDRDTRQQEIGEISAGLKVIARELDIPVIALAQLNRQSEMRAAGEPPKLSDLRESGTIEQDADMVIFLWKDPKAPSTPLADVVNMRIAKHRNGPLGDMLLTFRKTLVRFESYVDEAEDWRED